ncbi:uncharacterized protein LODBEIA_P24160 [Lodderomyces beijingensis]|uniref:WLM domain-containing protein n=1 Tax=Lodderomyces beijingensis TaxID=1775926 RepID=A0ABP0ZPT1_9ASCO
MVQKGRGKFPIKKVNRPSPVANVGKIGSLTRYDDREYANSLLHDAVKELGALIHEYNFKVGLLCEMFPKSPNLLGLNVNKGQKIMLRLRYHHNERSFLPMCDIIGTFLHELTHNVHGPHDKKFYDYLAQLEKRYGELKYGGGGKSNYRCEENTLGRGMLPNGLVDVRAKRLAVMSKTKFKAETHKLGGTGSRIGKPPSSLRQAVLDAVQRRLEDSKRCHSDRLGAEPGPDDDELDMEELVGDDGDDGDNEDKDDDDENDAPARSAIVPAKKLDLEFIDLTEDEKEDEKDKQEGDPRPMSEVIVID